MTVLLILFVIVLVIVLAVKIGLDHEFRDVTGEAWEEDD